MARSQLEIRAFAASVHLGCTEQERAIPQEIEVDVRIRFHPPEAGPGTPQADEVPMGTRTDRLEDTLCYDVICQTIRATVTRHPYRLIEAMARDIHVAVRESMNSRNDARNALEISVRKLRTPVKNLRGGACFIYGDEL